MQRAADLTHLQRLAIAEAFRSPSRSLVRVGASFTALNQREARSGMRRSPAFTLRLVRMLDRAYLIDFDDEAFPSRATLTSKGLRIGQELAAGAATGAEAKAGAA